jgi:hypothetical protein
MENSGNNKNNSNEFDALKGARDYILENPWLVLWNLSLLMGGVIIWIYFFQIRYFPDLKWDEVALLLPLAAITGVFFLLLMTTMFMAPYLLLATFLKAHDLDTQRKETKSSSENGELDPQKKETKTFSTLGLIWYFFSLFLLEMAFFLFLSKDEKFIFDESNYLLIWIFKNEKWLSFGLFLLVVSVTLIYLVFVKKAWGFLKIFIKQFFSSICQKNQNLGEGKDTEGTFEFIVPWIFSFLLSIVPLLLLIAITPQYSEELDHAGEIILLTKFFFSVLLVNGVYVYFREKDEKKWWVPFIPIGGLIFSLLVVLHDPVIPNLVMGKFKLGNYTVKQLLVDEKGCQIIENVESVSEFNKDKNYFVKAKNLCYLKDVTILSRLGSDIMLKIETVKGKKKIKRKFKIPKENVLSWLIIEEDELNDNNNDDSTQITKDETKQSARRAKK